MTAPRFRKTPLAALILALPLGVWATNGMNLEAYGARAGGMGGASYAYDNGNSAVMNNPATLGLRPQGSSLGLGVTVLMPDVSTRMNHPLAGPLSADSSADQFLMPSVSLIRKTGGLTYGAAITAQGGMGTDYGTQSFLSNGTGLPMRSEVGFGRVMLPLAFNIDERLTLAAQIDYVWAGMDVQMLMPDGSGHVSVSNNSDYTGQAKGRGWAFKLGAHYKLSDSVSVGATYHSKTDISDLEGSGTFTAFTPGGPVPMPTRFRIVDFQWPETYGIGAAWQATPQLMLAADIKHIGWSDSMKTFRLAMNMGAGWMEGAMPQNWKDQTVLLVGGQYMVAPNVALRAGYNHGSNPVPASTLNPLFPAIVTRHYTLGAGWNIGGGHSIAGSVAFSPKDTQTNPAMFGAGLAGTNTHSQTTLRVNYNYNF
ncbi:outer membrane protein transport protein [Ideonella sp. 4Y11]|uniref:Outer membrane protein transport protein n=1 Tax=Ideonella aquatica TaxID=2824119 RepID=A0A941BKT6_9BURK|nr:outer membrane protein transport protein [Ideonella aquatica]MBQ0960807.1 outer membrane protein transport protein [Ideonella aquatica]